MVIVAWDSSGTRTDVRDDRFLTYALAFSKVRPDLAKSFEIPENMTPTLYLSERRRFERLFKSFDPLNAYVQTGKKDGFVMMIALSEGAAIKTETEWNAYKLRILKDFGADVASFAGSYKAVRKEFMDHDKEGWLQLQPPFEGVDEAVRHYANRLGPQWVVTTKDRDNETSLNAHLSWSDIFPPERVMVSKEGKRAGLERIALETGSSLDQVMFIDDSAVNLAGCVLPGVTNPSLVMAGWGYATAQQKSDWQNQGLPYAATPKDLVPLLNARL